MTQKPAEDTPPAAEKDPLAGLVPGRIVHFHPSPYQARYASPGPWAAMVVLVGEIVGLTIDESRRGVVTLAVFPPTPTPVGTDPVARLEKVPYSAENAEGCWSWPER